VFARANGGRVVDPRKAWYALCLESKLGKWVEALRKDEKTKYKRYVGLQLHDFRRSAVRNMTKRGVDQSVAIKISGHKTASVFRRYRIVDDQDLAEATCWIEAGRDPVLLKSDTQTDTSAFANTTPEREVDASYVGTEGFEPSTFRV
jgi:hypothetical protein